MCKTNIIPTLLLLLFCTAACTSQGQSKKALQKEKKQIEKVAYGYLDAMGNYRISDVYKYADKETQDKTLRFIEERIMPITDTNYIKKETPAKITITGITITPLYKQGLLDLSSPTASSSESQSGRIVMEG